VRIRDEDEGESEMTVRWKDPGMAPAVRDL
jgi:hypothetical protein